MYGHSATQVDMATVIVMGGINAADDPNIYVLNFKNVTCFAVEHPFRSPISVGGLPSIPPHAAFLGTTNMVSEKDKVPRKPRKGEKKATNNPTSSLSPYLFVLAKEEEHLTLHQLNLLEGFDVWDKIESPGTENVVHPSLDFAIADMPDYTGVGGIDFIVVNGGNALVSSSRPQPEGGEGQEGQSATKGNLVEALPDTTFFSMKRNQWYPSSRFNILGSGPPSLTGHSLNYTQWRNDPGGVVVFSDSGVWLLGGVDNLASIISEKKAGKDEEGKGE